MGEKSKSRSPWTFVPTLYFAEGVPYTIINTVSVIFYKKLGVDNAQIALWTSFLYLPWVIKMFWGPLVDIYATKRSWIVYTEFAMSCCLSCVAFSLQLPHFFFISLVALIIGAFISATHDIAADGFYLLALSRKEQALFVGIQATFYRVAMLFGSGVLVFFAGQLELHLDSISVSWTITISLSALIFTALSIIHSLSLPHPESSLNQDLADSKENLGFFKVIRSYFSQEKIWVALAFIFLYRLGEAMIVKLASLFLLDDIEVGGLGLSTSDVGLAYGTFGITSAILGGILGGFLISRYGVRKSLFPMALALNLPNLFYIYMAYTQPSKELVYLLVTIEQFGYGLGTAAFGVYLMSLAKGEYKTSHFAISSGVMALGMMLPGLVSGYLQQAVGYPVFFTLVFFLAIPGIAALFFIPLEEESSTQAYPQAELP